MSVMRFVACELAVLVFEYVLCYDTIKSLSANGVRLFNEFKINYGQVLLLTKFCQRVMLLLPIWSILVIDGLFTGASCLFTLRFFLLAICLLCFVFMYICIIWVGIFSYNNYSRVRMTVGRVGAGFMPLFLYAIL